MFLRVCLCVIFSLLPAPFPLRYVGTWLQMKGIGPHHMTNTEKLTGKAILSGDGKTLARPLCEIKTSEQRSLFLPRWEHAVMPGLAHRPHFARDVNKQRRLASSRPPNAAEGRSLARSAVYARWAAVNTAVSQVLLVVRWNIDSGLVGLCESFVSVYRVFMRL